MRKWLCILLVLAMFSPITTVIAEEPLEDANAGSLVQADVEDEVETISRRQMMISGIVTAGRSVTVLAPFGGILEEVLVKKGDFVTPQDSLFTIATTKVYSPSDGVVRGLSAQVGDDTTHFQDRYGALMYIEPISAFLINTDTKNAYFTDENRIIHVGEVVYIGSRSNASHIGTGRIIAVNGESYTVEVTDGNLALSESVVIYRNAGFSTASKIGTGETELNSAIPIIGSGMVFALHASQGDAVERGDLLLETVAGETVYNQYPTNRILSGHTAVVAEVDVTSGMMVSQDQVLATLYPIYGFEVSVPMLESDLSEILVGSSVRMVFANSFESNPFEGTIVKISGLSDTELEEPEYTVTIAFTTHDVVRIGMNVNVYFNE